MAEIKESDVSYEELALIEDDLQDVEMEILRQQWKLSKDIYKKRAGLIARIPLFWSRVLHGSPTAIDEYFNLQDMDLLEQHVTGIDVSRFELEEAPSTGDPRSVSITFSFSPNAYLEDTTLEKKFWHRYASDGWQGYVSEPVKVHWKPGKDLTEGLTDAAVALWEARRKAHAADPTVKDETLPEYGEVIKRRDKTNNDSFFRFFGFVSAKRYVSAEESAEAVVAEKARREKSKDKGENVDEEPKEETMEDYDQDAEIMAEADDVVASIAEDLYPNALKYFTTAQELDDGDMSLDDFEDSEDAKGGDDQSDDEVVDIRSLVQGKGRPKSPPDKKRKK